MLTKDSSFEPRIGTAQLVFGVIYALITLIALSLALYVKAEGGQPYVQLFMAALFFILTLKSFLIYYRVKSLLKNGVKTVATLTSCEAVRGITVLKGTCQVEGFGEIEIQSRLAGTTVCREIENYLKDKEKLVPALVVNAKSKKPRGMFLIRTKSGHLDETTIKLER